MQLPGASLRHSPSVPGMALSVLYDDRGGLCEETRRVGRALWPAGGASVEDERFDELTQRLDHPVSRRDVVRLMGAAVGGGIAALFGARRSSAAGCRPITKPCSVPSDC